MARKLLLSGDALDLEYLATALPAGDVQVIKDGDRFYVTAKEADQIAEARVSELARRLVARINGIGRPGLTRPTSAGRRPRGCTAPGGRS
jgi:hypothetical protein